MEELQKGNPAKIAHPGGRPKDYWWQLHNSCGGSGSDTSDGSGSDTNAEPGSEANDESCSETRH